MWKKYRIRGGLSRGYERERGDGDIFWYNIMKVWRRI
jgi:hypothetical protein